MLPITFSEHSTLRVSLSILDKVLVRCKTLIFNSAVGKFRNYVFQDVIMKNSRERMYAGFANQKVYFSQFLPSYHHRNGPAIKDVAMFVILSFPTPLLFPFPPLPPRRILKLPRLSELLVPNHR